MLVSPDFPRSLPCKFVLVQGRATGLGLIRRRSEGSDVFPFHREHHSAIIPFSRDDERPDQYSTAICTFCVSLITYSLQGCVRDAFGRNTLAVARPGLMEATI